MYRRLKEMREDKDLRQKELAKHLHCTQVCYSRYELGKRDIPTDSLIKLAEFYDTSAWADKRAQTVPKKEKRGKVDNLSSDAFYFAAGG